MTALATSTTQARGLDLPTLRDILEDQQARKIDLVIAAANISVLEGELVIAGQEMILEDDGFTDPNGTYQISPRFDDGLAEKLDITPGYLRRLRFGKTYGTGREAKTTAPRLDIYDANINGLLHGRKAKVRQATTSEVISDEIEVEYSELEDRHYKVLREAVPADPRPFMVRLFRSDVTRRGIARALLSNKYLRLDNLDGVMAVLSGIQDAGIDPSTLRITGDITETRLYLHIDAPEIAALAPEIMRGYRSPFGNAATRGGRQVRGYTLEERRAIGQAFADGGRAEARELAGVGAHNIFAPEDMPIMFAGLDMTTSEVGNGSWRLVPRMTALECSNGYSFTTEGFARAHLGPAQEEGHIRWSADTSSKELALVQAKTRDVVQATLSQGFLQEKIEQISELSGKEIDPNQADKFIDTLALHKDLKWSQAERDGILNHFMQGNQYTSGGVLQAVTSFSQMLPDADAAFELNSTAIRALELAAR